MYGIYYQAANIDKYLCVSLLTAYLCISIAHLILKIILNFFYTLLYGRTQESKITSRRRRRRRSHDDKNEM